MIKNRVFEIESEIGKCENKISKFKKRIPITIIVGIIFPFIYPYLPRKYGRKPLIEEWEYNSSVIFLISVYFITFVIIYFYIVERNKKKIESLKRTKFSIENKPELYKSSRKKWTKIY